MWVVHDGKTCVMAWDNNKHDWIYIPERDWYNKMTSEEREQYIKWYMTFTCA